MANLIIKIKTSLGFTLIELLISISIFMIITAMVITNFRAGQYRDELVGAAEAIVTAAREVQTAATAGTLILCPGQTGKETPKNGYGINIGTDLTILSFGDCEDINSWYLYDSDDDFTFTTKFDVSRNVELVAFTPGGNSTPLNLVFSPFSEVVVVNGDANHTSLVTVKLRHVKSNNDIMVTLNPITGRIYYE